MASRRRVKRQGEHSRAVGYLRVSTDDQNLGIEAQREMISRDAARRGVQVTSWHADEGVSGTLPMARRPAFLEALSAMKASKSTVLFVAKPDRLTRAGDAQAETLAYAVYKHGGVIAYADGTSEADTANGKFQRRMMAAVAALERDYISERTIAALSVKKARGERTGRIPYGSKLAADGVHLEADPAEQAIIEQMTALREAGATLRGITAKLNEGPPPRNSRAWHLTSVAEILHRVATSTSGRSTARATRLEHSP
jgi:site-specific DNA recombinase